MKERTSCLVLDTQGQTHTLHIGVDGLTLDQHQIITISSSADQLLLMTAAAQIAVSPENIWYALAGNGAVPTVDEASQLLIGNLVRWYELQRYQSLVEALCQQSRRPMLDLFLPCSRLDPFVEAALSRCESRPTAEKVSALAAILDLPRERIVQLLRERGKDVADRAMPSEPETLPEAVPALELPVSEATEAARPSPGAPATLTKRTLFRWSEEMVEQLTDEFLAAPVNQSVNATARTIAGQHDWPVDGVTYKIYHLDLPSKRATQRGQSDAAEEHQEVVNEDVPSLAAVPAEDQCGQQPTENSVSPVNMPVEVQRGHVVWDIRVDGAVQRWPLAYPYGSFPFVVGQEMVYRDRTYEVQRVGTSTFSVMTASARGREEASLHERQEVLA